MLVRGTSKIIMLELFPFFIVLLAYDHVGSENVKMLLLLKLSILGTTFFPEVPIASQSPQKSVGEFRSFNFDQS